MQLQLYTDQDHCIGALSRIITGHLIEFVWIGALCLDLVALGLQFDHQINAGGKV